MTFDDITSANWPEAVHPTRAKARHSLIRSLIQRRVCAAESLRLHLISIPSVAPTKTRTQPRMQGRDAGTPARPNKSPTRSRRPLLARGDGTQRCSGHSQPARDCTGLWPQDLSSPSRHHSPVPVPGSPQNALGGSRNCEAAPSNKERPAKTHLAFDSADGRTVFLVPGWAWAHHCLRSLRRCEGYPSHHPSPRSARLSAPRFVGAGVGGRDSFRGRGPGGGGAGVRETRG